jgi:nitrite reductase/ring-hydroxylating ferredoxin subunit
MKHEFVDLGPVDALPSGAAVLCKEPGGRRFVCVREGDVVHALDDRCPHQGYPLSQGDLRGGVLTCAWHNWKFEVATGACTFGGEPVRRYPTRIEDGRVKLDLALDRGAETRRLVTSLKSALARDEVGRALREGLRLGALGLPRSEPSASLGALATAFEVLALDGAERAEYGFDHGLALLADLAAWAERGLLSTEEAFVVGAHAIAEPNKNLGRRVGGRPGTVRASLAELAELDGKDTTMVAEALIAERREEAEARVRAIVEVRGPDAACDALLPFVSRHLYDYGHGAIFLAKALELARRFPVAAIEVLAAATAELSWATADTSLPPFTATREALSDLASMAAGDAPLTEGDRAAFEASVLAGEREGVKAIAHAAAIRVRRYDAAWDLRLDAEVSVLDVTHAVTFTESAIALTDGRPDRASHAASFAVIAAGFVGKLRRADAESPPLGDAGARGSLVDAARARDVRRALGVAAGLGADARRAAYAELAPFAALEAAVRPIFYAHTVKTTEALRRLDEADPAADGAYLDALLSYIVPIRAEHRPRRTAAVAVKLMKDGRPPEGLY